MQALQNNKLILSIFLVLTGVVYWIYSQGFTGAFYFDDFRPLGNLQQVHDFKTEFQYITNETSGPLGRPVAMLSFLLNVGDWPDHPQNFFRINTIIHLLNGLIIYFLSLKLFKLVKPQSKYQALFALFTSFFWLVLPLNVSTSLIAVQRMASLSATFVFLGVLAYLYALDYQAQHLKRGQWVVYVVIAIFTLLAIFTKENGILLPLFLFVTEITLFKNQTEYQYGRKLRLVVLGGCYFIILAYLGSLLPHIANAYADRPYTFIERISTEPQILLDYLRLLFIPDIFSYNPFHDNYPTNSSLFATFYSGLSVVFWLALVILAVVFRQKFTVFSFAILWFLTAHILESTIVPLELYYEHRNYVAAFAICFCVVYLVTTIHGKKSQIFMAAFLSTYLVILAGCCYLVTKTWGNQYYAAYAWQYNQKGSMRATEHLALKLLADGNKPDALMFVKENTKNCPDCLNSYVQQMVIACSMNLNSSVQSARHYLLQYNRPLRSVAGLPSTLSSLFDMVENKQCKLVDLQTLKQLNQKFLQSPEGGINTGNHVGLHNNLYMIAVAEKNISEQERQINQIWMLSHDPWVANLKLEWLLQQHQYDQAIHFVQKDLCPSVKNSTSPLEQSCLQAPNKIKRAMMNGKN
ncbi:hypothetical protein [Acinetobacter sp. ANC 5502]